MSGVWVVFNVWPGNTLSTKFNEILQLVIKARDWLLLDDGQHLRFRHYLKPLFHSSVYVETNLYHNGLHPAHVSLLGLTIQRLLNFGSL